MQERTLVLILGAVAFSVVGQLFLKSGAQHLAGLGRLDFLLAAARDVHVLSGLAALTASTLCWLYVLRVAPLSRAYGLTSLTYVLVPLARAKSMPAFMSCDRAHFESYGPFEESWAILEEWPLTGAAYQYHHERFLYDRSLTARTSSRRMELQPFGYLRTFLKWVSVVLFPWARTSLVDRIRHKTGNR